MSDDGRVFTWGEAHWGQLGLSLQNKNVYQATPTLCKVLPDNSEEKIISLDCGTLPTLIFMCEYMHVYCRRHAHNRTLWYDDYDC